MRCHVSICRWSPRLGICLSRSSGASGCTTNGGKLSRIQHRGEAVQGLPVRVRPGAKARDDADPGDQGVALMRHSGVPAGHELRRQTDAAGGFQHRCPQGFVRERDDTIADFGFRHFLPVRGNAGLDHRVAGPVVQQVGLDLQRLAGAGRTTAFWLSRPGSGKPSSRSRARPAPASRRSGPWFRSAARRA